MFELSNGFCMGGVSKGKINLVELSNVRVNGQSSYRMLTVLQIYICKYYKYLPCAFMIVVLFIYK